MGLFHQVWSHRSSSFKKVTHNIQNSRSAETDPCVWVWDLWALCKGAPVRAGADLGRPLEGAVDLIPPWNIFGYYFPSTHTLLLSNISFHWETYSIHSIQYFSFRERRFILFDPTFSIIIGRVNQSQNWWILQKEYNHVGINRVPLS